MEHFTWDVSKEIFKIGSYGPRWYGLFFAIGFLVSYQIMQAIFLREKKDLHSLSSLLTHLMLGTVIGARLGHIIFYEPTRYLNDPIRIFYFWEGGLASHGGTIGVLFALWLYRRKHPDQGYLWLADRLSIGVAFTGASIRIGNFFNQEILGKASDLPWAIIFADRADGIPRHPAMLYESLSYLCLSAFLYMRYKKTEGKPEGQMLGIMFVWIFASRFLIEFVKENQVEFENAMSFNMGQILSVPFILLGLFLIVRGSKRELKTQP